MAPTVRRAASGAHQDHLPVGVLAYTRQALAGFVFSGRFGPRWVYCPIPVALGDEKYVLLTTFKRDGTPVATPVWAVPLDGGSLGFWTSSGSGKAKRLAHTDRVTVQACDMKGRVKADSQPVAATARVVTGAEFDDIHSRVVAKYGFMTKFTKTLNSIGG